MDPSQLIVADSETGIRLDAFLAARLREVNSRTYFQNLIKESLVLLNGAPAKKRVLLSGGDEVVVHFTLTHETGITAENIPLNVIYEDDEIIVVNKSANMVVHPAPGNWSGTFANALMGHLLRGQSGGGDVAALLESGGIRPGIVHRLDKGTSGVLVAAKTLKAQATLVDAFARRAVYKEYVAVVWGRLTEPFAINAAIGRHPIRRQSMAVVASGGKAAETEAYPIAVVGDVTVLRVVIKTGRTHQIRVHMQHRGCSIVGDTLYDCGGRNRKGVAARPLLHARCLRFEHPKSGKIMSFSAELPGDMSDYVV